MARGGHSGGSTYCSEQKDRSMCVRGKRRNATSPSSKTPPRMYKPSEMGNCRHNLVHQPDQEQLPEPASSG